MKQTIHLTESELKKMIFQTINEAENYGWVVPDDMAQEAYYFACDQLGKETIDDAIIRAMSSKVLAEILAYVFRQYDFREWDEYMENKENAEYDDDSEDMLNEAITKAMKKVLK